MTRHLVIAAAAAATMLAAMPAAAQTPARTLIFKEANKGSTFSFVDNPPRAKSRRRPSISPGDYIVIGTPLVDASGKHLGRLRAQCTYTEPTRNPDTAPALCFGIFKLAAGELDGMVVISGNSKTTNGSIIGGTGSYVGARGTFHSVQTKTGANDTITLLG